MQFNIRVLKVLQTVRVFHICGLITFFSIFSFNSSGAGITAHLYMADRAIEKVKHEEFRSFLLHNQNHIRTGSMFPDSGYIGNLNYGEIPHWAGFHNLYMKYLNQKCSWPLSSECEELFAFFLGNLSHALTDMSFHRYYISESADKDFHGDYSKAHKYCDVAVEFLSIMEHGRGIILPSYDYPIDDLKNIFDLTNDKVPREDLTKGTRLQYALALSERPAAPFVYLYYKLLAPWSSAHYMDAKGGIDDSAERVVALWEQVWERLNESKGFSKLMNFKSPGNWPAVDFILD